MDPLFRELQSLLESDQPFALGTVVHTSGSTPQRTGARAIFLQGGEILGTLGGGCMEAEARRRGLTLTRGGEPELLALHLDDDFGWDDGLICGGSAEILLQPRDPKLCEVAREIIALHERRGHGVFVLVVEGPAAARGNCGLIDESGRLMGTLGVGDLEAAALTHVTEVLRIGRDEPHRLRLPGSEVTLYFEPIFPKPVCLIAGAGHIGGALTHYAARVGFDVIIVDDRPSLCNRDRLPDADQAIAADIVETIRNWPIGPDTYVVIVTRGHRHDAVVLREVIHSTAGYIGMIGSKRKILTIYDEFLAEGIATAEELSRVAAPIGLDIGAISVDEIALCIAAELVLERRRKDGRRRLASDNRACAGGGRVEENGSAQAALTVRAGERAGSGRPMAQSLPRRPNPGDQRGAPAAD